MKYFVIGLFILTTYSVYERGWWYKCHGPSIWKKKDAICRPLNPSEEKNMTETHSWAAKPRALKLSRKPTASVLCIAYFLFHQENLILSVVVPANFYIRSPIVLIFGPKTRTITISRLNCLQPCTPPPSAISFYYLKHVKCLLDQYFFRFWFKQSWNLQLQLPIPWTIDNFHIRWRNRFQTQALNCYKNTWSQN